MALVAHWPLNGNLNDISGNGYTMLNYGATVNASGKIGQAYQFVGAENDYMRTPVLPQCGAFTYACWFKVNTWEVNDRLVWGYGSNRIIIGLESTNKLTWYIQTNTSTVGYKPSVMTIDPTAWNHVALKYDGSLATLYINGVADSNTGAISGLSLAGALNIGTNYNQSGYWFDGLMNDIRFYDHALTDFEIQELARAKILHYTFDDFQEPTTNLNYSPSPSTWVNSGAWTSDYNENDVERPFPNSSLSIWSGVVTTVGNIHFGFNITTVLPSTIYTISVWFRQNRAGCSAPYMRTSVNNNNIGTFMYNGDANSANWPVNKWIRITATGTTQSNETGIYLSNYIGTQVGDKIWYYGYQVEKKDHATPYVYGSRIGQVKDYSGFFNHSDALTEANTPEWTSESKVGLGAYYFNGSNMAIERPMLSQLGYNSFTINMWAWFDESNVRDIMFGNFSATNNFNFEKYTTNINSLRFYWNGSPDIITGNVVPIGQWCMLTAVRQRVSNVLSTIKIYVNGVSVYNQSNTVNDLTSLDGILRLGRDYRTTTEAMKGKLDDVRVYMEALSDKDILDIYQTRAEIEETGILYAKDFLSNAEETINLLYDHIILKNNDTSYSRGSSNYRVIINESNIEDSSGRVYSSFTGDANNDNNAQTYWNMTERTSDKGLQVTFSVDLKGTGTCHLTIYDDNSGYRTSPTITLTDQWTRYSYTATFGNYTTNHWCAVRGIVQATTVYVSNAQLEINDHATPFVMTYRPVVDLPSTLEFSGNEIHETGTANFEDFSTVGIYDGLVGYWNLGKNSKDYSGNGYLSTDTNMLYNGDSAIFGGTSFITLSSSIFLNSNQNFTVSYLVKTSSTATQSTLSNLSGGPVCNDFRIVNGYPLFYHYDGSWLSEQANTQINDGEWHLLTWVNYSNETMDIFVDGSLDKNVSSAISSTGTVNQIGKNWTTNYFIGELKNFKIFNRALTAEEVKLEYNTMLNNEVQIHESGILYAKDLIQY